MRFTVSRTGLPSTSTWDPPASTIWNGPDFIYVGMSYAHRDPTRNPTAKGVWGRLASHASGRRSGDQFCVYVCDRYVVPGLSTSDMNALAAGGRFLDQRTRQYIRGHLTFRVVFAADGQAARELEHYVRGEGLPAAGRPLFNP